MKFKYRLERCRLDGVKETSDRLTALGGQGWKVISTAHHGAELFVLLELAFEKPEQMKALTAEEPKRGPGRPKKPVDAVGIPVTSSAGKVSISGDGQVTVN